MSLDKTAKASRTAACFYPEPGATDEQAPEREREVTPRTGVWEQAFSLTIKLWLK
jgi:hypothetical protein